jgi:hypothetical protein
LHTDIAVELCAAAAEIPVRSTDKEMRVRARDTRRLEHIESSVGK